ncbi:MAG: glycosyltransferase family 2 protein [Candidatus Aegiribacteria sp.]|nr:glycosyltransferase family 2 protein [Candidatus Aegiribacteria sp.]
MNRITVITLNWNGAEVLSDMINSLAPQLLELQARLIVLDNCSTDGSDRAAFDEFGGEPWFSLIRAERNLGFAAGANRVIGNSDDEILVLANNDTVFTPGSLKLLVDALERHPEAGMAGPRLLWPDGSLQPSMRDFPFPGKLIREHLPFLRKKAAIHSLHLKEQKVDWLVGAVMAFRRKALLDTGLFDEDYFFYHEETDLQYRFHRSGWEVWFVPAASVVHLEGVAARQIFGRETWLRYIPGKIRFLRKHGRYGAVTSFRLFITLLHTCRMLAGLVEPGKRKQDIRYTMSYYRKAIRLTWKQN